MVVHGVMVLLGAVAIGVVGTILWFLWLTSQARRLQRLHDEVEEEYGGYGDRKRGGRG